MQRVNDLPEEEALLLFHYGELSPEDMQAWRGRLAKDAGLAERYADMSVFLDGMGDPFAHAMPDDLHARRMRTRIMAALPEGKGVSRNPVARWLGGGLAAAVVLALAFQLGRFSAEPDMPTPTVASADEQGADEQGADEQNVQARLLNASLSQHLEASSRFLRQVDNANLSTVDVESERNWAATLLVANRIYRIAAEQAGQHRVAAVLQDMEPVLLEMANQEGELTDEEFARLRQRIESRDLLFKVDVTSRSMTPNRKRNGSI